MAYQSKNLSALGYANGFTLWHYRTGDLAAEVDNAGLLQRRRAGWSASATSSCSMPASAPRRPTGSWSWSATPACTVDVTNVTTFGAVNTD